MIYGIPFWQVLMVFLMGLICGFALCAVTFGG